MQVNNKGFVFIETIVVICVLTVSLITLYTNYEKIMVNTKEFNTFDTTEYNYKTYFLKKKYFDRIGINACLSFESVFSDDGYVKLCKIEDTLDLDKYDAYIIDYLNNQEIKGTNIFLAEYKKNDTNDPDLYQTYISSINY